MSRNLLLLLLTLMSCLSSAATTNRYDFNVSRQGANIFAYKGTSLTQVPSTNATPSTENSTAEYRAISANDGSASVISTATSDYYPSIRYTIDIAEDRSNVSGLRFLWNGQAFNDGVDRSDGVQIFIWNFAKSRYELAVSNTTRTEVNLTFSATVNVPNYIDSATHRIIIYIVSQASAVAGSNNSIFTDYAQLTIRSETPTPANLLANFQFDECAYSGTGNEVIDQLGRYSATSHNSVNTSQDAKIVKALGISNAQQHIQTNILLPASYSVSTWFKKPTDNSDNPYFVLGAMESGGDLLVLERANNWRWAIYDVGSGSPIIVRGNYSFSGLDDNWHHMTLVYHANQTSLYIDGGFIETIGLAPSGTLKYIGTSFDDITTATPQGFRAPLDEFMIFNGVLTQAEIADIYTQQNSGKNYDGTNRVETPCATAIANFKFDEFEYADIAGEVIDSIGTFHGQAKLAQTVQGKVCRALDLSATGTRNYVVLDEAVLHNKSEFSISLWAKTPKTGAQSLIGGATTGSVNELIMWFTRDTSFRPYLQDTHNGSLTVSSIAGDTWRHLVWTQGNDQSCLFIDTVPQGCLNQTTSLLDIQSLIIGQEQDSVGGRFDSSQAYDGLLDELVIFEGVIEQNKIEQIYKYQNSGLGLNGETIDCPEPPIVRYEIVHDGSGFTCAAEPVTIKACTNSMCSRVSTEQVSLNFNITSPTAGLITKASPTFIGSTSFNFNHRTAETVTLSIGRASIAAQNATQCSGAGGSCDMSFDNSGYILTLADHNACTVPNLVIQAVKLSDNGVSCAPAYTGDQPVELTFNYQSPSAGTKLPDLAGTAMAASGVSQTRIVSFDSNATATLPFEYQDAGQIRISVQDASATGLASESVTTVVSPEQILISAPEVNAACLSADPNDAACSKFKAAGESFSLDLTATCADTAITTPNFQLYDIALSHDLIAPINKELGELAITSVDISAQGKARLTEQSISEVGVFTITATPPINGYFGKTIAATTSANIGRFVPDHFVVSSVFEGTLENRNGHSFVYTGEMDNTDITKGALSYKLLLEPEILITALNKNGATTQNYSNDFMRLSPASFNIKVPTVDVSRLEKAIDTDVISNINKLDSNIKDLEDGTIKYKFSNTDNFAYKKNTKALIGKYTGKLALQIDAIKDSDDVVATDTDSSTGNGILTLNPEGMEIRFGRWNIENTFGPENADLPLPMSIQYWHDGQFVTNELDSLTTFDGNVEANYAKDNNGLSPKLATNVVDVSGAGPTFTLGRGHLLLAKPSDGSRGQIRLTYKNVPNWLKYNWNSIDENSDGDVYDDNPSGVATFGVYRGNDRIISWREVAN